MVVVVAEILDVVQRLRPKKNRRKDLSLSSWGIANRKN